MIVLGSAELLQLSAHFGHLARSGFTGVSEPEPA